jgi:hypothetical protein
MSWPRLSFYHKAMSQCLQELGHTGARVILSTVNLLDHPPGRAVLFGVQQPAKRSKPEERNAESQRRRVIQDHQTDLRNRLTADQIFCIREKNWEYRTAVNSYL